MFPLFGRPSFDQAEAALAEAIPPTLWLLGKTGAGKTSIAAELTGRDDAEIGNGFAPCTQTAARYDFPDSQAPVLRFLDTRGLGETHYDPTADLAAFGEQTHLVLLVVRVADQSLDELVAVARQVRTAAPDRPTLLVLTCLHEATGGDESHRPDRFTDDPRPLPTEDEPELARLLTRQYERLEGLFDRAVPIDLTPVEWSFVDPRHGHDRLRAAILDLMPAAQKHAARAALLETDDTSTGQLRGHILGYATAAAGAAAVPFPLVDLPVVASLQWKLTSDIAAHHGQPFDGKARARLSSLIGGRAIVRLATRGLLKAIPFLGSALNATTAFATTYGAGAAADAYFAAMAINPAAAPNAEQLKAIYEEQIQRAMRLWSDE